MVSVDGFSRNYAGYLLIWPCTYRFFAMFKPRFMFTETGADISLLVLWSSIFCLIFAENQDKLSMICGQLEGGYSLIA